MNDIYKEFIPIKSTMKPSLAGAKLPPVSDSKYSHHQHPSKSMPHKVEKAYTEATDGDIIEGCKEHYYDRVVMVEKAEDYSGMLADIDMNELQKYLILGEILAPKF
ncbi:MAG: hypothetical protein GX242_02035 [Clostridiales bacterium]|mgnify:CR=1 FL=1|nr:hypothetical protein [Clostridiales bacterium]